MFPRYCNLVARFWYVVILLWLAVMAAGYFLAPRWDDVTYDGDLAYMPADVTSVQGERLLEKAFPGARAKSDIAFILARSNGPLTAEDFAYCDRVAARLHNLAAVSWFRKSESLWPKAAGLRDAEANAEADATFALADQLQRRARDAWDQALALDDRYAQAYHNQAVYLKKLGQYEQAAQSRRVALDYDPQLATAGDNLLPARMEPLPIIDIWTRHTDVVGEKLRSKDQQAQLIVLRLSQEFMATDNIRVLETVESSLESIRKQAPPGLTIGLTGAAAVGADMLRSAAESIKNTEWYTVLLVVAILVVVYRAPALTAVPLVTIGVSVVVATSLVAALTQLDRLPGMGWWDFKIFTTTKIFVIVILFGSGTDFCLFLIARYQEELKRHRTKRDALAAALGGVGSALTASALTTIVGLATMFFADFGKFRNSGPAIGLCLLVTLLACLSFAPALLCALGKSVFWPFGFGVTAAGHSGRAGQLREPGGWFDGFWRVSARLIVARPGLILIVSAAVMFPLAVMGSHVDVTYDLLSELEHDRPSKRGTELMRRHFPIGETGPLVVLVQTDHKDLDSREGKIALAELTKRLYVDGVESVRSLSEPLGDPPRRISLMSAAGRRKLTLQNHELSRSLYLSKRPELGGDVARFELVLTYNPFSIEAIQILNRIDQQVQADRTTTGSFWHGSQFLFSGTTAAIRDLRQVTRADNVRIQVLVVLAVLAVLLIILRRPIVCIYLILSVLFSYFVTIGITELFFQSVYGPTFEGLDWKVPLFLFVILVAVGQDYNIYLVTRIFEEQNEHGLFAGVRRAIVRTGGIITSCGLIMAGTFVSMTTGSLQAIVELGFALSLGVLLDTFVVRPILVPAFLALWMRIWVASRNRHDRPGTPERAIELTAVD